MVIKRNPWNKEYNKFTHPSVWKISQTLSAKPRSNFFHWQLKNKREYKSFLKNENLAEIIGVVIGDGHIQTFPLTERLIISCNSKNKGFIRRYKKLIKLVFGKVPHCIKSKDSNYVRISLYEKYISRRLKIPTGARGNHKVKIPNWIWRNRRFLIAYLKGLYEAEGSYCVHKPTYTHKMLLSNKNEFVLKNVFLALTKLGFHPHNEENKVQLSRKEEVNVFKNLIRFRKYA